MENDTQNKKFNKKKSSTSIILHQKTEKRHFHLKICQNENPSKKTPEKPR